MSTHFLYNPFSPNSAFNKAPIQWWRTTRYAAIPRALTSYHQVDCTGVPFHKLAQFAKLQAQAHSPFIQFDCSAAKQGRKLHIWIWEARHSQTVSETHGTKYKPIAQSLMVKPVSDGMIWNTHSDHAQLGHEAQLWVNRKLQHSLWFQARPTADAWHARIVNDPTLQALGWPLHLPHAVLANTLHRPWSRNLTPAQTPPVNWLRLSQGAALLCATVMSLWAGWLYGQTQGFKSRIQSNAATQEKQLADNTPQVMAKAKTSVHVQRIRQYQQLQSQPRITEILDTLSTQLNRQGLWVRDLDITPPTVEATIATPPGFTPKLTAIIGTLESSDIFYDARFVDVSGGNGFKFTWRLAATESATHSASDQGQKP
jgi:hypothetical protein